MSADKSNEADPTVTPLDYFTPREDVKWILSRTLWLIAGMMVAGWLM